MNGPSYVPGTGKWLRFLCALLCAGCAVVTLASADEAIKLQLNFTTGDILTYEGHASHVWEDKEQREPLAFFVPLAFRMLVGEWRLRKMAFDVTATHWVTDVSEDGTVTLISRCIVSEPDIKRGPSGSVSRIKLDRNGKVVKYPGAQLLSVAVHDANLNLGLLPGAIPSGPVKVGDVWHERVDWVRGHISPADGGIEARYEVTGRVAEAGYDCLEIEFKMPMAQCRGGQTIMASERIWIAEAEGIVVRIEGNLAGRGKDSGEWFCEFAELHLVDRQPGSGRPRLPRQVVEPINTAFDALEEGERVQENVWRAQAALAEAAAMAMLIRDSDWQLALLHTVMSVKILPRLDD